MDTPTKCYIFVSEYEFQYEDTCSKEEANSFPLSVAYDEPNGITIAAMKEAMSGKGKELDLAKWNEFVASL